MVAATSDRWLLEASPLTWLEAAEDGCCPGRQPGQLAGHGHLAWPCGFSSSQHSDWVPSLSFPGGPGGDSVTFSELSWEGT